MNSWIFGSVDGVALKSDHFGIEIYAGRYFKENNLELKSDHFGIEI